MCHMKIELCGWRALTSDVTTAHNTLKGEALASPSGSDDTACFDTQDTFFKVLCISRTPYFGESGI